MKFYAVVVGRKPGIYVTWVETEKQVKGYKGAKYKSFATRNEAMEFMESHNVVNTNKETSVEPTMVVAYTDGSMKDHIAGYGIVILKDFEKITAYGKVPESIGITNNVAELYAIYVTLSLVKTDILIKSDSAYAIGVLTSFIPKVNLELIDAIKKIMIGRKVMFEHVTAHIGIKYNEEADELANYARQQNESLVIMSDNKKIA